MKIKQGTYITLFLLIALIFNFSTVQAQGKNTGFCGSQDLHEKRIKTDKNYSKRYQQSQKLLKQANKRSNSTNNACFVVPIVFHVIHMGEAIGTGSNISDNDILEALDNLNSDFANDLGYGEEIPIQFCLASIDPSGAPSSGITRTDGVIFPDFYTEGFNIDDDDLIKNTTSWGLNYVNVWIGHKITNVDALGTTLGYANLPGTEPDPLQDGIVLDDLCVLDDDFENAFAHEAGHFFNLLHTFSTGCSSACNLTGDLCCDTRPHQVIFQPCVELNYTDCDPYYYAFDVSKNYMNYPDEITCMSIFTPDQCARAVDALVTLRPELMDANECSQCGQGDLTFEYSSEEDWVFDFTNTSSGIFPTSFSWEILELGISSNSTNFDHQFLDEGTYTIVLTGTNYNGCCISSAVTIEVNSCIYIGYEECNLVLNGNLEHVPDPTGWCSDIEDGCGPCNWESSFQSPSFCIGTDLNALALGDWTEAVQNTEQITLTAGVDYILTYEYFQSTQESDYTYSTQLEVDLGSEQLDLVLNPQIDQFNVGMSNCHNGDEWHQQSIPLNFGNDIQGTLSFKYTRIGNNSDLYTKAFMHIRNIKISDCDAQVSCEEIQDENIPALSKIVAANSIVTLQNGNYSLAGCLIKEQNSGFNTDHYFLTRDANDEPINYLFTGDIAEENFNSESTLDQTVLGNTIFSAGYSSNRQTQRDIHFTRKQQSASNFTWTKRLDYLGLSQTAYGIDAILLEDAFPSLRIFLTGDTKVNNQYHTDIFLQRINGQGSPIGGIRYASDKFDFSYDIKLIDNTNFNPPSAFMVGSSNGRPLGFRVNIATGDIISQFQLKINPGQLNAIAQNENKLYLAGRIDNDILLMRYNLTTNNVESSRRISAGERSSQAHDIIFHEDFLYLVGEHSGGGNPNKDGILLKINPSTFQIEFSRATTLEESEFFKSLDVQNDQLILAGSITQDSDTEMFFVRSTLNGESCCLAKSAHLVEEAPQPFIKPLKRTELPVPHRFTYVNEKEHLQTDEICFGDGYGIVEEPLIELRENRMLDDMTIYPNPALDEVNIISNKNIVAIDIFTLSGHNAISISLADSRKYLRINTSGLYSGMYLLRIKNTDGSLSSKKLLIQR